MTKPKQQTYIVYFKHFAFRLSQRYGILITFEQYCELCDIWPDNGKVRQQEGCRTVYDGYLDINGYRVLVRKDFKTHQLLLTALCIKRKKTIINKPDIGITEVRTISI